MLCLHLWYCRDRTVGKENARDGKRVDHRGSPDFPSDCLARSRGVSSDHSLATCRDYREVLSKFHVPCSSPANLGIFLGWVERVRVRVRERERERERKREASLDGSACSSMPTSTLLMWKEVRRSKSLQYVSYVDLLLFFGSWEWVFMYCEP